MNIEEFYQSEIELYKKRTVKSGEIAVRAAKAFTGKLGLVKILGGYHGTTDMMEYNVSPVIDLNNTASAFVPKPDIKGVSERIAEDMYIMNYHFQT